MSFVPIVNFAQIPPPFCITSGGENAIGTAEPLELRGCFHILRDDDGNHDQPAHVIEDFYRCCLFTFLPLKFTFIGIATLTIDLHPFESVAWSVSNQVNGIYFYQLSQNKEIIGQGKLIILH